MKNKFALGLFTGVGAILLIAAAEYDLNKGVDLTGLTSVTPTKLNQLVDNGTVAGNKGMLICQTNTPDTTNNTRYTRFMWMNTSYDPPRPFVYQTNGGVWTNITAVSTIASNSVTAGALAANSVYGINIANAQIDNTKMISGTVNSNILGASSVYAFHIADGTITSAKIGSNQVLSANIGASEVTGSKIAPGSIGTYHLTNGFSLAGSNIAGGTITSVNVASNGIALTNLDMTAGSANQVLRINSARTAIQWATDPYIFVSTNMVITAAATTVVTNYAHGLGALPDAVIINMVCRADSVSHGYTIGAKVPINVFGNANARMSPVSVMADATSIHVSRLVAGNSYIVTQSTLAEIGITQAQLASDWYVQVRCIKYNR